MSSSSSDLPVELPKEDGKTYTLSSKDVQLMLTVLNVVSSRGCFKPVEFKPVGELFETLSQLTKDDEKKD